MNPAEATKAVHQVLLQIQSGQNLDCPSLNDLIRPLHDLRKFDSPMSLLATGMVGRKLGLVIPAKTNIFGDKKGLYTIGEAVALLCNFAEAQKGKELAKV